MFMVLYHRALDASSNLTNTLKFLSPYLFRFLLAQVFDKVVNRSSFRTFCE